MSDRIQITNSIAGQLLAGVPLHILRNSNNEIANYDAEELLTAMAEQILTLRSELYVSACQQGDLRVELDERKQEHKELSARHAKLLQRQEDLDERLTALEAEPFNIPFGQVVGSPEKGLTVGLSPQVDINKEVFERLGSVYPKWLSVNPEDYCIRPEHTCDNAIADKLIERFKYVTQPISMKS